MARPITIPNVFQNQTGNIPLSQLDTDFSTLATAINDPASYSNYAVDSGIVNAYIITLNPAPSTLASMVGVTITFKPLVTNTGASTINVNGFGAINIVNTDSSALISGEIVAGNIFQLSYNGTNFILMSVSTNLANLANVTGVLTESHGGTGTTTGYYGFKNRIINGAMMISQRGTSFTGTAPQYTLDRWRFQIPTAGGVTQITSTIAGFAYSWKYISSGSNAYMQMGQPIEYNNFYDCDGQTVTISFWAKANNTNAGSTALIGRMRYLSAVDGACIFAGANTDTAITITTTATKYTFTYAVPANAGSISCEIVLNANVSGDGFELTGVQLEKGTTATSFDYRPYGTELALCQRYYQLLGQGFTGCVEGTSNITINEKFQVPMRSAPSTTIVSGQICNIRYLGGDVNNASPTLSAASASINGLWTLVVGFTGLVSNTPIQSRNNATNNLFIAVSSEL